MKRLIVVLLVLSGLTSYAKPKFVAPDIEWQASFGGTNTDGVFGFAETADKGFVIGGYSSSGPSGNKTSPCYGTNDYWVIRLDKNGNKIWEQTYGGSDDERISKILVLPGGDILLAGYSRSGTNAIKSAPNRGGYDYWLVKIHDNGDKIWDKTYGGSGNDYLEVIASTPSGGFLLGGQSGSTVSGTKTAALKNLNDYWLVAIDSNGTQLWDKSYGGATSFSTQNSLEVIQPVTGGDFLLAGWSGSATGNDKSAPYYGSLDWWLLRVNASGTKIWDKSFGGSGYETVWGIQQSTADNFLVGGLSNSSDGTRTNATFGTNDFWILRMDGNGNVLSQKTHGGTGLDDCRTFVPTADGGGLFCGKSASPPSGNKTSAWYGDNDYWVIRVDTDGDKIWETSVGGSGLDDPFYVIQTSEGGYLIGGRSDSPVSGNKTAPNYGGQDIWLVKLAKEKHQVSVDDSKTVMQSTNGFQFSLSGVSNVYVAEYTTNFVDWIPFQTNQISVIAGVIQISHSTNAAPGKKFYRTRQLGP